MDTLIAKAGEYGVIGLTLLASFWYIQKKDTEHIEERKESIAMLEERHIEAVRAIDNNTKVLTEIGAIIKNK